MLDESPTSANRNTISIGIRSYVQRGQYHTIVESCVHLTMTTRRFFY